ncbi:MAG: hypothetical protein AMS18_09045 [Gemmatimonas sp. SG8_17]|nr:MAG: hypothetical protein AMS18_09045 [Gemmatimonas sp. SG8_17]
MRLSHQLLRAVALTVPLTLLGSTALTAQAVQGRLIDQMSGSPIDRAFVVLLDAMSVEVGRVFTDAQGRFRVNAPGPGTFHLRSERIGFKATVSDTFNLAAGTTHQIDMRVEPVAIRLDVIEIEGDAKKCRLTTEHGLETATVWEEARKALASVAWSESNQAFTYEIKRYELYYEPSGRPNNETSRIIRRTSVLPFNPPSAAELQERGWVVEEGVEDAVYDAPDAQVFFSDAFLDYHCFKLKRDKELQGFVGLEFEPTSGDTPDVNGVMWLDEQTAELRWLQLGYENLRSHTRERYAEARIEFDRLPTGMWFVKRWYIKMPMVEIRTPRVSGAVYREEILHGYIEEGREVLKVMTVRGELLWEVSPDSTSVP